MLVPIMLVASAGFASQTALELHGTFVEGCSCKGVCAFETSGTNTGCNVIGGYSISKGKFGASDISGTRFGFVIVPGGDVYAYVDAPNETKQKSTMKMCASAFKDYGKLISVKPARIAITGTRGNYNLTIDEGKIAALHIKPLFGGDGKGYVKITNPHGNLYRSLFQGETKAGACRVSGHDFELKASNAFFNDQLSIKTHI